MSDRSYQARPDVGREMTLAFEYIQQVFRETAKLITKLDDLMGSDWASAYGNRTHKGATSHLGHPDEWLVRASFRIYESTAMPSVRKGITVTYWGGGIEQPILIGGQVDYILDADTGGFVASDHLDLLTAWFEQDPEDKRIDGTVYRVNLEEAPLKDRIREAGVFAIPLAGIQSEDDIRTEVYDRLMGIKGELLSYR